MAFSLASLKRSGQTKPERICLYGTHGVGKTSFAASAPAPIFLQTEDGLGAIEGAATWGVLPDYPAVSEAIDALGMEQHDFQTVVLDSLDWLEPMIWAETCRRNKWPDIESPGYGKGYAAASDIWRELLVGMNALRDIKGMTVVMIAHAEIKRFDSPEVDSYDRYQPKLNKGGAALVQENVDSVLFNTHLTSAVPINPKDKNSRMRGVGGGQRVLYTEERPAHLAKNRCRMPAQIMLPDDPTQGWATLAQHIPHYRNQQKES